MTVINVRRLSAVNEELMKSLTDYQNFFDPK